MTPISDQAATVPARSADQHGANVARLARVRVSLPLAGRVVSLNG